MLPYKEQIEEVFLELKTDSNGLSKQEVEIRHERDGFHEWEEEKQEGILQIFLNQFKDVLVIVLIVAAIISALSGSKDSAIVIVLVITMNAILGTYQSIKAQKSLEGLKKLSASHCKVMRDGHLHEIETREICIGDIVYVEAGDIIAGDGRVFSSNLLSVDESSLTGESSAVMKQIDRLEETLPIADQINMVFSGSLVTNGTGSYVVTYIGADTQLGQIATMLNKTKQRKTPLQVNLDEFSKKLSVAIIIICIIVTGLNMIGGSSFLDASMVGVALAVAAIPEALASIVTIVLALGTNKMVKEHVIMKNINAVESLGCVSVICSDKTGTLTQNKMQIQQAYLGETCISINELDTEKEYVKAILDCGYYCNNASIREGQRVGDPMEIALLDVVSKYHVSYADLTRINEQPFDSIRKLMSVQYQQNNGSIIYSKGACDELIKRCTTILDDTGIRPLHEKDIELILQQNEMFARKGMRVLGFAYRRIDTVDIVNEMEDEFTFIGLLSFMDPPRVESAQAIEECRQAHIRVLMISGDHKITTQSIGEQIGVYKEGDLCISGEEIDAMSEDELMEKLESITVYARVAPAHKIRIVKAWQKKGQIVAMTGDGVNDAPALKQSDIGIAMGITGTEVSKDAASMILTDDNFASIVKAVETGRNIYANIKHSILYLLSGNLSAIIVVLLTSLLMWKVPFLPVHLLFINLITDSLPAIAIGMEKGKNDVMKDMPRMKNESILNKRSCIQIGLEGICISIAVMVAYLLGYETNYETAVTMAFATLCLSRLLHGFSSRSRFPLHKIGFFSNKYSIYAFFAGFALLSIILFVPAFHSFFMVTELAMRNILTIYLLAIITMMCVQITKVFLSKMKTDD